MKISFWILIPFLCLAGCKGSKKHRLQSEKGLKVRFEVKNFQDQMGECDKPEGHCAQIDMVYPVVVEGVPDVQKSINDSIYSFLVQNLVLEDSLVGQDEPTLKLAAKSFLKDWQLANEAEPDNESTASWEVSVTGEVGLHTPKVASITLGAYSYAGGAHPNSFVSVLNFNLNNGKVLNWPDLITDIEALKKIAVKEFKKARELPDDADLTDSGFFWGEEFQLPKNFELQKEGIYFWYNPYEAASYADGPTDFLIKYEVLNRILRKELVF